MKKDNAIHFKKIELPEAVFKGILPIFFEEISEGLEAIKLALKENRIQDIPDFLHKMKGTARGYGAELIGGRVELLEQAIKDNEAMDRLEEGTQLLDSAIFEAKSFAQEHFGI